MASGRTKSTIFHTKRGPYFKKVELFKTSNLKTKISQEEIATSDRGYLGTERQKEVFESKKTKDDVLIRINKKNLVTNSH